MSALDASFAGDDFAAGLADEVGDPPAAVVFAGVETGLAAGDDFAAGAGAAEVEDAGVADGDAAGAIPESVAAAFFLLLLLGAGLVESALAPAAAGALDVDPDAAGAVVASPLAADFLLFLLLLVVPVALASPLAGTEASPVAGVVVSAVDFLLFFLLVFAGVVESVAAAD
jgi:hypothetical protein